MRKMILTLAAGALALAGCGGSPAAGPGSAPTAISTPAARPTAAPEPTGAPAPTAAPTSAPAPSPAGGTSVRPPDDLVTAAQRQLAAYLKADPSAVVLQSGNYRDWPDAGLGCPQPGTAYPQVITPGFLLVFTDPAQKQSYDVHTGMAPAELVLCVNQQPVSLGAPAAGASPAAGAPPAAISDAAALDEAGLRALAQAQMALVRDLGVSLGEVTFVQAEPVEWNDSSLGCPKPDQAYMQVITSGYKVTLEAQGQRYEYHTDMGKRAVRCESN